VSILEQLEWFDWPILVVGIGTIVALILQRNAVKAHWSGGVAAAQERPVRMIDPLMGIFIFLLGNMILSLVAILIDPSIQAPAEGQVGLTKDQTALFSLLSLPAWAGVAVALICFPLYRSAVPSIRYQASEENIEGEVLPNIDSYYSLNLNRIVPSFIIAVLAFSVILPLCVITSELWSMMLTSLNITTDSQQVVKQMLEHRATPVFYAMAFHAVILVPFVEESVFRGMLLPLLLKGNNAWFAIFVVAVFFASIHMNVFSFAPLLVLAMMLGAVYIYAKSLWAPVFLHMLFNGYTVMIMIKHGAESA